MIWVDSPYARNLAMGIWLPRGSTMELVREVQAMWRRTQALRGRRVVRIEHVRSHTAVPTSPLQVQIEKIIRAY